jgi:hypothetical protein
MLSQKPYAFVSALFQKGDGMKTGKLHYGWIVISMGLLTTIASHGFGRMSYTIILPAMKDGLQFNYTQLSLLGTGNFLGYLTMAVIGGFLADTTTSFTVPFQVAGGISLAGMILFFCSKKAD